MIEIPPPYVLKAAREALAKSSNYIQYVSILSLYYQVARPNGPVTYEEECKKEGPRVIACYDPKLRTIYCLGKTMKEDSVLHEFYHYLSHVNTTTFRTYTKKERDAEQSLAIAFASTCMEVT